MENKQGENSKKGSRRDFIKKAGLFGAGALTGAGALYAGFVYENSKADRRLYSLRRTINW
jgi:hypothetical protein